MTIGSVFMAHFERKTTKLNESARFDLFADCLTKKAGEFWISLTQFHLKQLSTTDSKIEIQIR